MIKATKGEVEEFLNQMNQKIKVFGIVFRNDRTKNQNTLLELEILPKYREDIIKSLSSEDYVQRPIKDTLNNLGDMWVFGKDVKGREVYIKISLGKPNLSAVCISFHIAEYKLTYKFK